MDADLEMDLDAQVTMTKRELLYLCSWFAVTTGQACATGTVSPSRASAIVHMAMAEDEMLYQSGLLQVNAFLAAGNRIPAEGL